MTLYRPLAAVPQTRIEPHNSSLEEVMNKPLTLHELLPWIASPVFGDMTEHPMLNLVPLAGAWGKMAD